MSRQNPGFGAKRASVARRRQRQLASWTEHEWLYDAELGHVLHEVRIIRDPASRARQAGRLIGLRRELHEIRRDAVQQMHAAGCTWSEIGERLGITKARAHELGRDESYVRS